MLESMSKYKMTDRWVSAFRPASGRVDVGDLLCPGLYLRASATGAKAWSAVVRVGEKVRRITIGRYPIVTLSAARSETLRLLREVAEGADIRAKTAAAERAVTLKVIAEELTFGDMVDSYVTHLKRNAKSWAFIASNLKRPEMQPLHLLPAGSVGKGPLMAVIDDLAQTKPHAATNLHRHVKMMLNHSVTRDLIAFNPLDKTRAPTKTTERDRILSDDELGKVWRAAGNMPQPWCGMIRMLMLTGQRRCEVSNMAWSEIEGASWVIPRERVKKDRPHAVPLVETALQVLAPLRRMPLEGFVFTTDSGATASSNFAKAKRKLDELSGVTGWVLHDLRRTVRSGLASLGVSREVARAIVNHADGKIDRVYNRYSYATEKREALVLWEQYLLAQI